jgi:hypothetical protein
MVDLHIGDLVYLDDESVVGMIVDISVYAIGYAYGSASLRIADIEVLWSSGERYWCLAESLTVISKYDQNNPI